MTEFNSIQANPAKAIQNHIKKSTIAEQKSPTELTQLKEIPNSVAGRDLVQNVKTVKAGNPILTSGFEAQTKGGTATFKLAEGTEVFPDIWSEAGNNYTPKKGDIIMTYGEATRDWGIKNPNVLKEMDEKGLKSFTDRAVSSEPELMYRTYVGQDGRDFTKNPLKPGESVPSKKLQFPAKFNFVEPGTMVETLEAREGSGQLAKVGAFQFVQADINGNPYVKDIKDIPKRLEPTTEESKEIFKKVKDLIKKRELIQSKNLSESATSKMIEEVWKEALPTLKKVVK